MKEDKEVCLICQKKTEILREKGLNGVVVCICPLCKKRWYENGN